MDNINIIKRLAEALSEAYNAHNVRIQSCDVIVSCFTKHPKIINNIKTMIENKKYIKKEILAAYFSILFDKNCFDKKILSECMDVYFNSIVDIVGVNVGDSENVDVYKCILSRIYDDENVITLP